MAMPSWGGRMEVGKKPEIRLSFLFFPNAKDKGTSSPSKRWKEAIPCHRTS